MAFRCHRRVWGKFSVRKQLVIVGHSREGLELVPLLEANPGVDVRALVSEDPDAIHATLAEIDPMLAARFASRVSSDLSAALDAPGLTAVIDAEASRSMRAQLEKTHGVQVTTPVLAKLLFGFGSADAFSKPDLLQALRDTLDSYNLALDRRGLLDRVLQIAVSATGADRGSIMLWDPARRVLRVDVALGIEPELIPKIQVPSGEGVAGRAFAAERPILINGKADRSKYQITRERDDIESAISAPLVHGDDVIGVLNVSHARDQDVFDASDLEFVEQLACLDARLIARAEEYHQLLLESGTLRAEAQVRRLMGSADSLGLRLENVCAEIAASMSGSLCQLYLRDPDQQALFLQSTSSAHLPIASRDRLAMGEGLPGSVAASGERVFLSSGVGESSVYYACLPIQAGDERLGVLVFQGTGDGSASELLEPKLAAVCSALAEELGEALRSARLEREARRTAALSELFAASGVASEAGELYEFITGSASSILEAQDTVLRLREGDSGRFRIVSWTGLGEWREAPLADFERQLASEAIRTRRTVRVGETTGDAALGVEAAGIGSAMVHPLVEGERVIGSLSALGKVPEEPLLGENFDAADEQILQRLAQHAQTLVEGARQPVAAADHIDAESGLPAAAALRERLEEELARSQLRGHPLALVRLGFPGLAASSERAEISLALAEAIRLQLREFDVIGRPEAEVFVVLVPEPDADVSRLLSMLGRVARGILERHLAIAEIDLQIGYARFPEDGDDAGKLEAVAARARVETL
jgi:GAF domain-containing protein